MGHVTSVGKRAERRASAVTTTGRQARRYLLVPKPSTAHRGPQFVNRKVNMLSIFLDVMGEADARYTGADCDDLDRFELKDLNNVSSTSTTIR